MDNPLEEQLDGFASIGKEGASPGLGVLGQLLGGEQPAAVLGIEGDEVRPTKGGVAEQQRGHWELLGDQARGTRLDSCKNRELGYRGRTG